MQYFVQNTDTSSNPDLVETFTTAHFGANFLVNQLPTGSDATALDAFLKTVQLIGPTGLRWPGGTVTETVFDFRNENAPVMNGNQTITQHQFFATAGVLHAHVTLTLQTRLAFGAAHTAANALADGTYGNRQVDPAYLADMKAYIERTLADAAASGTHIKVFEIGNEFWGGAEMTATEYGRVARALLTTVNQVLSEAIPAGDPRPGVAIQSLWAAGYMSPASSSDVYVHDGVVDNQFHAGWTKYTIAGQGTAYNQAIKIADEITGKAEGGSNLSGLVTGLIDHYYPKCGLSGIDGDKEGFIFSQFNTMERRLGFGYGALDRNMTEWNGSRFIDLNHDGIDDNGACNRGMPQAALMVHMMYEMATHGVTSADAWPLYFAKVNESNLIGGANYDLRIPGQALQLMSESLVGTRPLFDFTKTDGPVTLSVHGFSNDHKLVLMAANQSDVTAANTTLDLSGVGGTTMQSQFDNGHYFITTAILNGADSLGNPDTGVMNTNVHPVLTYTDGAMMSGHIISEGNMAAWDLARTEITFVSSAADLVIGREGNDSIFGDGGNDTLIGGGGQDTLIGSLGADNLQGGAGNDMLYGMAGPDWMVGGDGNDALYGGPGSDTTFGGDGNDFIFCGAGNDVETGGFGADHFIFANGAGKDEVTDFSSLQHDVIDLSQMLGTNDVTNLADVQKRMVQVGSDVHIMFSGSELIFDHMLIAQFTADDFIF